MPAASTAGLAKPQTLGEIIVHLFPVSIIDAMARNDVLQIVAFSVLFAIAVVAAGPAGKPVITFCESVTQVMLEVRGHHHEGSAVRCWRGDRTDRGAPGHRLAA